ncbi:MAG: hypothetical protein GKR90_21145 [Pseudomonadales bacterium]|nr:hypothetical protein [Pseudomonadales bacterium]
MSLAQRRTKQGCSIKVSKVDMFATLTKDPRALLTPFCLTLALVVSTHYSDPGFNSSFLWLTFVFLLASYCASLFMPQSRELDTPALVSLHFLGALLLHQLFITRSPDSSFVFALTFAAIPLTSLVVQRANGQRIFEWFFVVVFAMASYSAMRYIGWQERAHSPMFDPNNYVTLLYLVWIPWAHQQVVSKAWVSKNKPLLAWLVLGSFVFSLAMLATHSRFAWLALVTPIIFWLIATRRLQREALPLVGVVLGIVLAGSTYFLLGSEQVSDNVVGLVSQAADAESSDRLLLLESVWRMYESVGSWLGHGLYTFSLLYPAFRHTGEQSTAGLFAHNDYVQIGFEGGLLLLIPILAIGFIIAVKLIRSLLRKDTSTATGYALAAGMAFVHANVNFVFYILPLAIMLGVVLSLAFHESEGRPTSNAIDLSVTAALFVAILFLALDVVGYGVFSGQRGVPGAEWVRADAKRFETFVDMSRILNPRRGLPHLAAAEIASRSETENPEVVALYDHAIKTDPWNPIGFVRYSEFLSGQPDADPLLYESLLRRARTLNPQDVDVGIMWIMHQERKGLKVQDELLALAGWCELVAKRGTEDLDRLGRFLTSYLSQKPSDALSRAVAECRSAREDRKGTTRQATWLQRWLMS